MTRHTIEAVTAAVPITETDPRAIDGRDLQAIDRVLVGVATTEKGRSARSDELFVEVRLRAEARGVVDTA